MDSWTPVILVLVVFPLLAGIITTCYVSATKRRERAAQPRVAVPSRRYVPVDPRPQAQAHVTELRARIQEISNTLPTSFEEGRRRDAAIASAELALATAELQLSTSQVQSQVRQPGWQPTRGQVVGAGALGFAAGAVWEHHHQQQNDLAQAQEAQYDATMAEILYNQHSHLPQANDWVEPHYHHGVYWEQHHHW
jgi:hypothetical protein